MYVQPTAISRRREGVTKGSKLAPSGRPPKRPLDDDPSAQTKHRLYRLRSLYNLWTKRSLCCLFKLCVVY